MDYAAKRLDLLHWLRSQLIGPGHSGEFSIQGPPLNRYHQGILFPMMEGGDDMEVISEEQEDTDQGEESTYAESTQTKAGYKPPSSVGFSFCVRGDLFVFEIRCSGVRYAQEPWRDKEGRFVSATFHRVNLAGPDGESWTLQAPSTKIQNSHHRKEGILGGKAELDVLWRAKDDGWLVTVSLINSQN
ncbi:MAG: hypothetical protein KGY41_03295, partial [Desulfovermiculus sp.]|nr:hypothetical protein [Desulfovermiculus sp.]